MPFTVSHVIAVIPFRKAGLPLLPLAVGSMAPDFFYFTPGHYGSMFGHSLAGVFLATLPMAWLVLWFFRCFLREPLLLLPPKRHQALLAELAGDPPADSRWARPGATALLLLAGIATHLFWDSFTHQEGVMVQHFAVLHTTMLPTPIGPLALARVLQHGCSFAGLGMLAAWYLWLFHRRKTAGILPEPAAEQLPPRVRRLLRLALIAVAAITAAAVFYHKSGNPEPGDTPRGHLMKSIWSGITYGIMALFIAASAYSLAWRRKVHTRAGKIRDPADFDPN